MITIRSIDRAAKSISSSDCSFTLSTPLQLGTGNKTRQLRLEYAQVYNTPYLIQAAINDRISFLENATAKVATITAGYYNALTLASEIATKMTAISGGYNTYAVTYSAITGKLTWTAANAFTIQSLTGTNASLNPWKVIGMISSNGLAAIDGTSGVSYTAPYPVNLSMPLSWYVDIPEWGSPSQSTGKPLYGLYLPMAVGTGNAMEYTSMMPRQHLSCSLPWVASFTVKWSSSATSPLELQNSEWELVFSVHDA
jgi:hypothetical protein